MRQGAAQANDGEREGGTATDHEVDDCAHDNYPGCGQGTYLRNRGQPLRCASLRRRSWMTSKVRAPTSGGAGASQGASVSVVSASVKPCAQRARMVDRLNS